LKKALFAVAATALLVASPAIAKRSTAQYTSITTFGDSLVDAGNIFALTGGTTPSAALGYFNGRFTNGYNYNDLLSIDLFGAPTVASSFGGLNFAYGGARGTTTSGVPDLLEQMALYNAYLGGGGSVDANGLYILNFGGNDLFNVPGQVATAATNIANSVKTLNDLGARNILVTGFPPVGGDNAAIGLGETTLLTALAGLSLDSNTTLMTFSNITFLQTAALNPTAVGLPVGLNMNPATNCITANAQASGCAGYFYFDSVHPTAQVQLAAYNAMNAQFGLTAIQAVPEPGTWAMMIIGFGLIGSALRRSKARLSVSYATA
jgi:outer membrane lipase/esterase